MRHAFGVSGGSIAPLWAALSASPIAGGHFRHESGAAFAATEAHFATGEPIVVFTTTGPGLTNALTGLLPARGEGAKIIVLSGCTSAAQRGKSPIQETDADTIPAGLATSGALFHMATPWKRPTPCRNWASSSPTACGGSAVSSPTSRTADFAKPGSVCLRLPS